MIKQGSRQSADAQKFYASGESPILKRSCARKTGYVRRKFSPAVGRRENVFSGSSEGGHDLAIYVPMVSGEKKANDES